jgi:hypothetical protein
MLDKDQRRSLVGNNMLFLIIPNITRQAFVFWAGMKIDITMITRIINISLNVSIFQYTQLVQTNKKKSYWCRKKHISKKPCPPARHEFIYTVETVKQKTNTEAEEYAFNY